MKDKCFEIGTIQAFTDGELATGLSERLLKHVSGCADCSAALAACEEESSFAYSLLDEELNVLVPTERLRTKVFGSIEELETNRRTGWLSGLAAGLAGAFSFKSPGLAVAASVLMLVGIVALTVNVLKQSPEVSEVGGPAVESVSSQQLASVEDPVDLPADPAPVTVVDDGEEDEYQPAPSRKRRFRAQTADFRPGTDEMAEPAVIPASARNATVTSEDSYLQSIETLDRSVATGKEMLSPSERIAFERDLAVVNNAIVSMKEEVRRNPDNRAAREVLKASYQNKVDLLNSVAEKTELMASLQ